jgi:phosphatidylglycerophosphate synthase
MSAPSEVPDEPPPTVVPCTTIDWKRRLEDPANTYYRYPLARLLVRGLVKTPITPNQVTCIQPLLAALAGWFVTYDDRFHLLLAVALFELRSILDCADGTLAREKKMSSPVGHAIDGIADWVCVLLLYAGIFWHFHQHPPPLGPWTPIAPAGVLALALLQAGWRSFASDYYKTKYLSIFGRGHDETVESLRRKILALGPSSPLFAHAEVTIGKLGFFSFEHEWFDPRKSPDTDHVKQLLREEHSALARFIGLLWSVSNGDAFLTLLVVTILFDQLWLGQVVFATIGFVSIHLVVLLNWLWLRGAARRAKLALV